jgi:hypothetical protein
MSDTAQGPSVPNITIRNLIEQFWADIYGKEVQSANTYSYTWIADQTGHLYIGIIVNFALTVLAGLALPWLGIGASWADFVGLVLAIFAVSMWEYRAFRSSVVAATPTFPLDRDLLARNAVIASVYMALGGVAGFGFHIGIARPCHFHCDFGHCNTSGSAMASPEDYLAEGGAALSI